MRRRDFLKGLVGVATGVTGEACTPTAENETTPDVTTTPDTTTIDISEDIGTDAPRNKETEIPHELSPEAVVPRTSAALEARINIRMNELRTAFGAEIHFEEALNAEYAGEPIMDIVYDTFEKSIAKYPTVGQIDAAARRWMLEVCCYGEVTAESAWDMKAIGADNDRGLWQLTETAAAQIAIERSALDITPSEVNPFDPVDATRGAASYFDFTLRSLTPWIDKEADDNNGTPEDSEELNIFDLQNETEFIIPLIITGYKCGPEPLKTALSAFYRSNPDTSLVGLDVFFSFVDYMHEHPVDGISETDLDYFLKCLSLKRIFDTLNNKE